MEPQRPFYGQPDSPAQGGTTSPTPPDWYVPPLPPPPPLPPSERPRNGFSVAGLVLGIVPIAGGILGIIFGLIGRSQAKQRGQRGRVMGTWGAALGAGWMAIIIVAVVAQQANDAERGDDGLVTDPGQESAFSLRVGDCLRTLPADSSEVEDVDLVPCTRAHNGEVYATPALDGSTYPGNTAVSRRSERACIDAFEGFVGTAYNDSTLDVFFLRPTARSWRLDDRGVTCLISGKGLAGSAKGSKR